MKALTIVALCTGLAAAPLLARAADLVLFDNAGRPVAVLVPQETPTMAGLADPWFAEQDAIMDRMMRTMDAAFSSGPMPLDPAGLGRMSPGSTVITTSFSDGRTSCTRTMRYEQRGNAPPVVNVSQTGDACGTLRGPGTDPGHTTTTVPAALPAPDAAAPSALPGEAKLIRVMDRHPTAKPLTHRG